MKLKMISGFALGLLSLTMTAKANVILLTANQPMKVVFRIAHLNHNGVAVLGEPQLIDLNKNKSMTIGMDNYDLAGLVISSINSHELPLSANQFNKPNQCSLTTDKTKATGALSLSVSEHEIKCNSYGGIFG